MSNTIAPAFDFCALQRFVNNVGGCDEHPAFPTAPRWAGDRLTQYGFGERIWMPPAVPGVYAITACITDCIPRFGGSTDFVPRGYEHIIYIGCSKNIAKRLEHPDHPWNIIDERLFADENGRAIRVLPTEDYRWVEKSLIRTLRPLLNIQHNG